MHEMSIAHSILTQVEELTIEHNAKKALWVKVRIGVLAGIITQQLKFAFDIYRKEFQGCQDLEIKIQDQPLVIKCRQCGKLSEHQEYTVDCAYCKSVDTEVIDGKDMILEQVELDLDGQ